MANMSISMGEQTSTFILTVCVGFFIGFVYDLFRILRKTLKHVNIFTQLEDLIFWIFVSLVMYYILLSKNYGEVRAFSIIGAFIGMIIYFMTLSQIFVPITVKTIGLIKKCIVFIIKIAFIPINFVIKLVKYPYNFFKNLFIHLKKLSLKAGRKGTSKLKRKTKGFIKEMKVILNKK